MMMMTMITIIIIGVLRRRRYCDLRHGVYVCVRASVIKRKPLLGMTSNLAQ